MNSLNYRLHIYQIAYFKSQIYTHNKFLANIHEIVFGLHSLFRLTTILINISNECLNNDFGEVNRNIVIIQVACLSSSSA